MDANGRLEDGFEQMLHMYLLGQLSVYKMNPQLEVPKTFMFNLADLRKAYEQICGVVPDDAVIRRWIGQLNDLLPYLQNPKG